MQETKQTAQVQTNSCHHGAIIEFHRDMPFSSVPPPCTSGLAWLDDDDDVAVVARRLSSIQ
jgi:hypothetical protein